MNHEMRQHSEDNNLRRWSYWSNYMYSKSNLHL